MPYAPKRHQPAGTGNSKKEYDQRRKNKPQRKLRNSHQWQRVRQLVMQSHPLCWLCLRAGRTTAATHIHHIQGIEVRPDLTFDRANLVPLCNRCHVSIEAKERAGQRTAELFKDWRG